MTLKLPKAPDFLERPVYLPRVTRQDGPAIEDALAGPTLFDRGVQLQSALVEATYAAESPPIIKRLREADVAQLIEPQTLRFTGERFLTTETFKQVPYAPAEPISADGFTRSQAETLAREVMGFQQRCGASCYLTAALPYYDRDFQKWMNHNNQLLAASTAANGGDDLDRRPLIAQVAPGRRALADPKLIVNRLLDHPIDAVYVQALRLNPVHDSLEKLVQYTRFLLAIQAEGLPVIAARVGAFGLVLQALGISAFDSGLARAEASDLAALNRPLTERERLRAGKGGGPDRRIYIEGLRTTLKGRHAGAILGDRALRGRFVCTRGCCQHRGFEDLPDRRRQHYLWVRDSEVTELRDRPSLALRQDLVHEQLRDAREAGRHVRRVLATKSLHDLPSFEHLDRWIGVLARDLEIPATA